mgnify:FL=1
MKEILITQTALEHMWQVSQHCPTETGGVLVGTIHHPLILDAGDPGPQAVKTYASFSTDPVHDQQTLQAARARYSPVLEVLGYWHKHPPGMTHPSAGDLQQARALLVDLESLGVKDSWLLCLILQQAAQPANAAYPYLLTAGEAGFRALGLAVIPEQDPRVHQAIQAEPLPLQANEAGHPWQSPNFQFHHTPLGAVRLHQEKARLEQAGFQVQFRQRKSDQRLSLWLKRGILELLCVLPVEYPVGMPRFYQLPEGLEVFPLIARPAWNSDLFLSDCLAGFEAPVQPEQAAAPLSPALACPVPIPADGISWLLLTGTAGLLGFAFGWFLSRRGSGIPIKERK